MQTTGAPATRAGEEPRSHHPAAGAAGRKKAAVATPGEAAWRTVPLPCEEGRRPAPPAAGSGPNRVPRSGYYPLEVAGPHARCRHLRDSHGGATTGARAAARETGSPGTGLSRATGRHEHARPSAASLGPGASCQTSSSCVASQRVDRDRSPPSRRAAVWLPCACRRREVRGWGCVGHVTGLRTRRSRHHPGDPHGDRATRTGRRWATDPHLGAGPGQNHGHHPCLVHVTSTWPDRHLGRCPWSCRRPSGAIHRPDPPWQLPGAHGGDAPCYEPEATRAAKCRPGCPKARPLLTNSSLTSLRCRRRPSWNWTNQRTTSRPTHSTTRCCHWPHPAALNGPCEPTSRHRQ